MKMTNEIREKLENLQNVLKDKYEIESKIQELPKALEVSTEALEHYKKDYIEKNAEYESEKAKVSALRLELDEAVRSREMGEKNMDDIKTHREYEILDKQISEAQSREEEIRKNLQHEERTLEELKDNLSGDEELIKNQEAEVEEIKAKNDANMENYQRTLAELQEQEQEASKDMENEIVYKFQRIVQRNQKGIVALKGNICEGCLMILPFQFATEVRRGDSVLFCPYCSRVIYYDETLDNEDNEISPEDTTGSLIDDDDENENEEGTEDEINEGASSDEMAYDASDDSDN